jgi:hypothetical protein
MIGLIMLAMVVGLSQGKEEWEGEMIKMFLPIAGQFITLAEKVGVTNYVKHLTASSKDEIREKLFKHFNATLLGEECASLKDNQQLFSCYVKALCLLHLENPSECHDLLNTTKQGSNVWGLMMNFIKDDIGLSWFPSDLWLSSKRMEEYKEKIAKGLCILLQSDMDMTISSEMRSSEGYQAFWGAEGLNTLHYREWDDDYTLEDYFVWNGSKEYEAIKYMTTGLGPQFEPFMINLKDAYMAFILAFIK